MCEPDSEASAASSQRIEPSSASSMSRADSRAEYRQRVEWCVISSMRTAKWNIGSKLSGMSSAEQLVEPSILSGVLENWQRANQRAERGTVSGGSGQAAHRQSSIRLSGAP
jgi:hypothetical protein